MHYRFFCAAFVFLFFPELGRGQFTLVPIADPGGPATVIGGEMNRAAGLLLFQSQVGNRYILEQSSLPDAGSWTWSHVDFIRADSDASNTPFPIDGEARIFRLRNMNQELERYREFVLRRFRGSYRHLLTRNGPGAGGLTGVSYMVEVVDDSFVRAQAMDGSKTILAGSEEAASILAIQDVLTLIESALNAPDQKLELDLMETTTLPRRLVISRDDETLYDLELAFPQFQDPSLDERLTEAKERWENNRLPAYRAVRELYCFCGGIPRASYRVDGTTITEEVLENPIRDSSLALTVEQMFQLIESDAEGTPFRQVVEFDDVYGYPTRYAIDSWAGIADDEFTNLFEVEPVQASRLDLPSE